MAKTYCTLSDVVGLELAGVCFVRDFVELLFDGPVVRILSNYNIESRKDEDQRLQFIKLIGTKIVEMKESDSGVTFSFSEGENLSVTIDESQGECMHYISYPDKKMQIW